MTNILVTGGAGQVGQVFRALGLSELAVCDRQAIDITDTQSIIQALRRFRPTILINAAAYTNVERAEIEQEQAFAINEKAAGLLAERCAEHGVQLIHLSTDYVFDGTKGAPYEVADQTNPLNRYGQSKLAGEKAVLSANPQAIIVRTAWLYSEFGENFQTKILRAAKDKLQKGEALSVVSDEWGSPTYAPDLVHFLMQLSQQYASHHGRILHFAGHQVMHRLAQAERLLAAALVRGELAELPKINAVLSQDFPTLAKRPTNSALKSSLLNVA